MMIRTPATVAKSIDIQQICQEEFGVSFDVKRIIADSLLTDKGSYTTVFETTSHEIYAYCHSDNDLTQRDIKRILNRAGIKPNAYLPPAGQPHYFTHFGIAGFKTAYPGRVLQPGNDLSFYESLAPYNPALVKVSEIGGELREYNRALNIWQNARDFRYKQIAVSL